MRHAIEIKAEWKSKRGTILLCKLSAYIHQLYFLTPYEGTISLLYKMNITQPQVHHFDELIKYNYGAGEKTDPERIACFFILLLPNCSS